MTPRYFFSWLVYFFRLLLLPSIFIFKVVLLELRLFILWANNSRFSSFLLLYIEGVINKFYVLITV